MAFAQQHRRPQHRRQLSVSTDDLLSDHETHQDFTTSLILSPRVVTPPTQRQQQQSTASDSDNDWHVISSAASRRTSTTNNDLRRDSASSTLGPPSDTSSSLRQGSDTESFSDIDAISVRNNNEFTTLPAHDGTGTFLLDEETGYFSDGTNRSQDEPDSPLSFARRVHRMLDPNNRRDSNESPLVWRAQLNDFMPDSASMPNILLPHGGITIPSFAVNDNNYDNNNNNNNNNTTEATSEEQSNHEKVQENKDQDPKHNNNNNNNSSSSSEEHPLPSFRPTVAGFPIHDIQSQSDTSASHNTSLSNDVKFTRRRRRNLDSIPSHHPAIPGTIASAAVLSAIWDQIRRITTHILENDANTSETFTNLVSEAAFEGCMPFGSHLHMDFGGSFLSPHPSSRKRVDTWY